MRRDRHAFTIVELLVALAITSLLVVLLVNVVTATLNVWEQGRNQIDTFGNARQTLSRIADEIAGAIAAPLPNQIEFWENLPSLNSDPPALTAPVDGISENVFFVASYPNSAAGDLCIIAYRHDNTGHRLQRAFVDSQKAWASPTPSPTPVPRYQAASYINLDWRTIATGVLEFEIRSYSQADLDVSPTPTPPQTPPPTWSSTSATTAMTGNVPRRIMIRIKVVDEKTLTKLNGLSPGNATYDRLVTRAAREFIRNITLTPPH